MPGKVSCCRCRRGQLHIESDFTFVAQHAKFYCAGLLVVLFVFVLRALIFVAGLCSKLLAQVSDGTNTLAIQRSDDIAGLYSCFLCRRTGIYGTHQNSLTLRGSKK